MVIGTIMDLQFSYAHLKEIIINSLIKMPTLYKINEVRLLIKRHISIKTCHTCSNTCARCTEFPSIKRLLHS